MYVFNGGKLWTLSYTLRRVKNTQFEPLRLDERLSSYDLREIARSEMNKIVLPGFIFRAHNKSEVKNVGQLFGESL